ncbi:MAG: carbonic anhydrase [Candidatus Glassbacteria bacterium]|nr:carbonic anhydrase [Candidatus Glassbacteria bacterium]
MSVIDETLAANQAYASRFGLADLPMPPGRNLAVVACMDARVTVEELLGLKTGDAHIIRNAGGIVTDDALRSLVISSRLLGTKEFMIINHTDCGMLTFKDEDLVNRLVDESGTAVVSPSAFHAFGSLEENVRRQVSKVKHHPWIDEGILVRGFVFDVKSGALTEIN